MNAGRIEKYRQQLRNRPAMFGGWLQNHALKALAEDDSAEAMRALAEAVSEADDGVLAATALELLRERAADGNVAAREALCRLVIHHDDPHARKIVLAAGYVPHEESNRALFYFLTERWEEY